MTNKFKILAVLMALVMMVSIFTACGKKPAPVEDTPTSSTTESTTEDTAVAPIEVDKETESTSAEKETSTTTTTKPNNSNVTTTKPSSSSKPVTTTKPAQKPANNTTTTTTQASGSKYAYFTASTGEKIKYASYSDLDGATCVGKPVESNGVITVTYDNGRTSVWEKCSNCGKYLCTGCVTEDYNAPCKYCGRTDCVRFLSDVECYGCGRPVKANTCHHCLP